MTNFILIIIRFNCTLKTLAYKFRIEYILYIFYSEFVGDCRDVVIPSSIPNLEVKHIIADNTAKFLGGNVGRCQLFRVFNKLYLNLIFC